MLLLLENKRKEKAVGTAPNKRARPAGEYGSGETPSNRWETMKETIIRQDLGHEFHIAENCHITEIVNSIEDPQLSIARARVEPGVTTRWHRLAGTSERYYILSGSGVVEVGELSPQAVSAGDTVIIPPMCRQRISNSGSEDLIFLAICTPRFSMENYQDVEDGQDIFP